MTREWARHAKVTRTRHISYHRPAAFTSAGAELGPVTPELIGAIDMDEGDVVRILCYAAAVSEAADKLTQRTGRIGA